MKNVHMHSYKKIELIPINTIENNHYEGSAGDKAFLMKSCECGDKLAFDYGATKQMKINLKNLGRGER